MKQNNKIWIETSFVLNNTTGIGAYVLTLMQCFKLQGLYFKKINLKLPYKKFKFIFHFLWMNTILYLKTFWEKPDIIIFPAFVMPYIRPSTSRASASRSNSGVLRASTNTLSAPLFRNPTPTPTAVRPPILHSSPSWGWLGTTAPRRRRCRSASSSRSGSPTSILATRRGLISAVQAFRT